MRGNRQEVKEGREIKTGKGEEWKGISREKKEDKGRKKDQKNKEKKGEEGTDEKRWK